MISADRFRLTLPRRVRSGRGSVTELPLLLDDARSKIAIVGGSGEAPQEVRRLLVAGASSTKGNPVNLTDPTLHRILDGVCGSSNEAVHNV